jgi:hypothetical protein
MGSVFKRLRQPAVCDVLRKAAYINPFSIPYILFKAVFRYPLYFFTLLLFVKNFRALIELFLFKKSVRLLDFRFGLGRFRLDIDNVLLLAELFLRGMYYYKVSDRMYIRFYGGYVSSPSAGRPSLLSEPLEKLYHVFSYSGRVLDVGGYLGETAFLFKKWGADEAVVYEPDTVLAKHVRETMFLNGVKGVVYELFVNCSDSHNSISWAEVLKEKFDIAKVDCEGCENGLSSLPAEYLRKVPKWIIECHSSKTFRQLAEKFLSAGFKVTFRPYLWLREYSILGRKALFHSKTKIPEGFLLIMYAHIDSSGINEGQSRILSTKVK